MHAVPATHLGVFTDRPPDRPTPRPTPTDQPGGVRRLQHPDCLRRPHGGCGKPVAALRHAATQWSVVPAARHQWPAATTWRPSRGALMGCGAAWRARGLRGPNSCGTTSLNVASLAGGDPTMRCTPLVHASRRAGGNDNAHHHRSACRSRSGRMPQKEQAHAGAGGAPHHNIERVPEQKARPITVALGGRLSRSRPTYADSCPSRCHTTSRRPRREVRRHCSRSIDFQRQSSP